MTPVNQASGNDFVTTISRFKKKQVLVLGKDTGPELQRLIEICDVLREIGYKPVLVKEHQDIPELSNEEKVRVFADASRFVIIENTHPAGQIVECKICSTNRIIAASLRERGKGASFMVTDYFMDFDFMKEFEYEYNSESLCEAINKAGGWAETKITERIAYYNNLYPWRKPENTELT